MDYKKFLKEVRLKLSEKELKTKLQEMIAIDQKYYEKKITVEELLEIVSEYETKEERKSEITSCQILTIGNPEIIFRLGIEVVRNHLKEVFISIDDFCLAQDKLIVAMFQKIFYENNMKIQFILDNLTKEEILLENGKKYDKTISISDSYRYYAYQDSIPNMLFYPYHIFEVYADDEFEDLKRRIYDYCELNGYEFINHDEELTLEEVISLMNTRGYGDAAVLLSKDEEKQKLFRKKVHLKNKIINENPLKKVKFVLDF